MKRIIAYLAGMIILVLLGILGVNVFKGQGPRERLKADDGETILSEELSYYKGSQKIFGKVFKLADENGNYPDSTGPRPVVVFFHDPVKAAWPEQVVKSIVSKGLVGYTCAYHGRPKDVETIVRKIRKEKFVTQDLLFIISDSCSSAGAVEAVSHLGRKVAGLVLVEPELTGKAAAVYQRYGAEFLTIDSASKGNVVALVCGYLEQRGALK